MTASGNRGDFMYMTTTQQKTILCYGDSNTYGYSPLNGMRYPATVRWTGQLQILLGKDYRVIEEGCNGRTTIFDDPVEGWKNGYDYLRPCLNSHKPVDLVIIMLGSNDLKRVFHMSAEEIAKGAEVLVKEILFFTDMKQGFQSQIILVSPPILGEKITTTAFSNSFDKESVEKSKELAVYYRQVAERNGCIFFNAAEYIESSELDCLHLMPDAHAKLAEELAKVVKKIF